MMMKYECLLAYSVSAAALIAAPIVAAQTPVRPDSALTQPATAPADEGAGVADIVVTAQRRAESLQKTALTIQVLNSKSLATAGVTSPSLLTSALPTVQIATAGPATAVYVRGVGGFAANSLTSPAVPYYFDGVYVGRTQSVISEFYDVDRLELVKGPQGTLYGRNASGGAINVLTRRPVLGRVEGHGDLEIGNYDNENGEVAINLPIGASAALRASGTIVDKHGFTSVSLGDDIHQAGRLKFLWQASPDISLLLNGSYGHIGGRGGAYVALNRNIPGWYPWLDASDPRSQAFIQNTSAGAPFVQPTRPDQARQNLDFYNISGQLDWNFGATTLTVIPAYRYAKMRYTALLGFLFQNGYELGSLPAKPETSTATSVEVRLSGNSAALKWVAGLYYYNEDQAQQLVINSGFFSDNGFALSPGTRSYAAFGQATVSLTDHVRLIGGLRYTSDRRSLDGNFYLISPAVFVPPNTPCAFPFPTQPQCLIDTFSGHKTYKNLSWKAGFEADVFGTSLLYATASRGFKAGGFSQQSALGTPGKAQPFRPETLTSYEAGLKSRFANNRLQVNISAFYWDYKDHQEPVIAFTNAGTANQVYINAGKSEIYGGNLDVIVRPWRGGTLSGSVEYAHSKYNNFLYTTPTFVYFSDPTAFGCPAAPGPVLTTLNCSGFQVSRTPEFSGQVGINQEIPLGAAKLIASSSLSFASSRWLGTDFIPTERAKGYGKLDASLTYQAAGDHWALTGFVRNITNAVVYTEAAKIPFAALVYGNVQPPRSYGARLSLNF